MLSPELLQKVRLIEIASRKVVDDVLTGQYKSHFKGQGVQFSEHRQYVPGDDVRHINWSATARAKEPLVKKFDEERELTVFLLIDVSGSAGFGSARKLKMEIAAEIAGMLACAAIRTGDKIGALFFSGKVEKILPPKKGKQQVLRIIRELLNYSDQSGKDPFYHGGKGGAEGAVQSPPGTDLAGALEAAGHIMKHKGIVFVLSDLLAPAFAIPLRRMARRHDLVTISIEDERERSLPDVGEILFLNPETGEESWVNTSSYRFRVWFEGLIKKTEGEHQETFRKNQVERLRIFTKDDYAEAVVRFFRARGQKR